MADHVEEEVFDLSKMKMAELKAELGARGLKTSGKKAELIDRLQTYMEENEDVEVEDPEEDALLLDETAEADALNQESEPASQEDTEEEEVLKEAENNAGDDVVMEAENAEAPTADKVDDEVPASAEEDVAEKKEEIPSTEEAPTSAADDDDLLLQSDDKDEVEEVPVTKKLMPRIEFPSKEEAKPKVGDGDQSGEKKKLTEAERLEKRKARFGNLVATNGSSDTTATKNKEAATDNNKSSGKTKVGKLSKDGAEIDPDKLKKRAERFGSTVASTLVESEQKDAIEKRKRRFGGGGVENGSSAEAATTTDSEAEAKKAKRAERFQAAAATATA